MRRAAVARRPEGRCRHIWCMQVKIRGGVKASRTVVHVSARQVIHLATNAPDLTIRAFRILLSALLHPYEVCAAHTCRLCEAVPDSMHHFRWYCAHAWEAGPCSLGFDLHLAEQVLGLADQQCGE
jgi:hypothetical protein